MRTYWIALLFAGGLIGAVKAPVVDAPRTVVVGERSVVDVYIAIGYEILLVLPPQEKIRQSFGGDSDNWQVTSGKVAGRFISVKMKSPEAQQTTVNVISDHDKSYTFRLIRSETRCDSKVFIDPDSQLAEELSKTPDFVPAADGEKMRAEAEKTRAAAAEEIKNAKVKADTDAELYRASYPHKLNFNYRWNTEAAAKKMGVEMIWDDGLFTWIRINTQEAPAIYEMKDGKPSIVRAPLDKGLYTIERVLDSGYLARGKKEKAAFERVQHKEN